MKCQTIKSNVAAESSTIKKAYKSLFYKLLFLTS